MKEIKFRYVFRKPNGHIIKYFTDIPHLERGGIDLFLESNFLSLERDLLSRDLYIEHRDRRNKEIYARDIIECKVMRDDNINYWINKPPRYLVGWVEGGHQWGIKPQGDSAFLDLPFFLALHWEIIGNTHETPELLAKEE